MSPRLPENPPSPPSYQLGAHPRFRATTQKQNTLFCAIISAQKPSVHDITSKLLPFFVSTTPRYFQSEVDTDDFIALVPTDQGRVGGYPSDLLRSAPPPPAIGTLLDHSKPLEIAFAELQAFPEKQQQKNTTNPGTSLARDTTAAAPILSSETKSLGSGTKLSGPKKERINPAEGEGTLPKSASVGSRAWTEMPANRIKADNWREIASNFGFTAGIHVAASEDNIFCPENRRSFDTSSLSCPQGSEDLDFCTFSLLLSGLG
ncbi:hypothetical protein BJ166DRAFT_491313 [Pestalotiopsis sp. NC0098]|nr:hypothetical protein BJ166DRAFT_491313 [Pestalotiopsis sp. NC0098]